MKKFSPLLLPLLTLAACQSEPILSDQWQALPVAKHFQVDYQGEILAGGIGRTFASAMASDDPLNQGVDASDSKGDWAIRTLIVKLSRPAVVRLLPEALNGKAGYLSSQEVVNTLRAMVEAGDAELMSSPNLTVYDRTKASLMVMNQRAYVESFGLVNTAEAMLIDPKIATFLGGYALLVAPSTAQEPNGSIDFQFDWSELLSMAEVSSNYPDSAPILTMQVPIYSMQNLSGSYQVEEGRAIHLPAITIFGGEILLIFIEGKFMPSCQEANHFPSFSEIIQNAKDSEAGRFLKEGQ